MAYSLEIQASIALLFPFYLLALALLSGHIKFRSQPAATSPRLCLDFHNWEWLFNSLLIRLLISLQLATRSTGRSISFTLFRQGTLSSLTFPSCEKYCWSVPRHFAEPKSSRRYSRLPAQVKDCSEQRDNSGQSFVVITPLLSPSEMLSSCSEPSSMKRIKWLRNLSYN